MPSRNSVKSFEPESMYHVYNRGVDKRIIFKDERDYAVFLSFLKYALLSDDEIKQVSLVDKNSISDSARFNLRREGLADKLELVSFCLMPNHFHLLLYQYDQEAITKLMRSIGTGYSMYFNKRYGRTGTLFQGVYKASRINSEGFWQHISRYIHLNPVDLGVDYETYTYSSYRNYIGTAKTDWLKPELVLGGFSKKSEYKKFVKDYLPYRKELKDIKELLANSGEIKT
jgi:putative transposase